MKDAGKALSAEEIDALGMTVEQLEAMYVAGGLNHISGDEIENLGRRAMARAALAA
jgi:hypothetical protein